MTEKKLTVEELVKALRCCNQSKGHRCSDCPIFSRYAYGVCKRNVDAQAADALGSLDAERDGYKEQLVAALAENTRLAEKLAVKSEQLESLRIIFYEVTGFVPSKDLQPMPLPKTPKEEK